MSAIATAIVASAAIGAGVSIYASSQRGSDAITSMPASYYTYDEDGNLQGSQVWDASKNAYVTRNYLTPEQQAEKEKVTELKNQLYQNLSSTPDDRRAAYDEYANAYSTAMHKDADKQYDKLKTASEESMAAKGMFGSKAYVDTMAELNQQKLDMDTDIANKAVMAKEDLANSDRQYWLSELAALDNSQNTKNAQAIESMRLGSGIAAQGTAANQANNDLINSATMQNWQNRITSLNNLSSNLSNSASGLAFLYGYKNKGTTQTKIQLP